MPPIRRYPTGGQYRDSLYNTDLCFRDSVLKGSIVTKDRLEMPKLISGNFASVFTVRSPNNQQWAVKCFTRFVDNQEERYQRISEALRPVKKPWRVGFDYLPEGVMCEGRWYPILKMEWVDAVELIPFIEKHLWDPSRIADLATKFARMIEDLAALGIAHGDLQHGNLLVTSSGELKLIDYDGMYVPSLARMGACEVGHANYQSPARTISSWGPYLDNFSAWVIYASLVALTIDPSLWTLLRDQRCCSRKTTSEISELRVPFRSWLRVMCQTCKRSVQESKRCGCPMYEPSPCLIHARYQLRANSRL